MSKQWRTTLRRNAAPPSVSSLHLVEVLCVSCDEKSKTTWVQRQAVGGWFSTRWPRACLPRELKSLGIYFTTCIAQQCSRSFLRVEHKEKPKKPLCFDTLVWRPITLMDTFPCVIGGDWVHKEEADGLSLTVVFRDIYSTFNWACELYEYCMCALAGPIIVSKSLK